MFAKSLKFSQVFSVKQIKNPLIFGSAVLFSGNMAANFCSYLYHLLMGRMLGPTNYGILESLISIIYLLGIPLSVLALVIVKFVSTQNNKPGFSKIASMYLSFNRKLLVLGLVALGMFLSLSPFISSFLHLDAPVAFLILGGVFFVSVFNTINRAFLQGLLKFVPLSTSIALESFLKFSLAVLFVWLGFQINGAMIPFLAGAIATYFFTRVFISKATKEAKKEATVDYLEMVNYAFPVFVATLGFTSLYTADIILVRHFLPAQEAGYYSALSVLGKIIFFVTSPIGAVLFPIVSEKHANGKPYFNLLFKSFVLVFAACLVVSFIYLFFPEMMINTLFGKEYLPASPQLFPFALFLSLYSMTFLLSTFFLSIYKLQAVIFPAVSALAQAILLAFFHQSLSQVISVSILVTTLLLLTQIVYYFLNYRREGAYALAK